MNSTTQARDVFDPEDPRLTAFALGELEGEEHARVEALIAASEPARRFVEDVRATAQTVQRALALENAPRLSPGQRAAIDARSAPPRSARRFVWIGAAAAGILAVGAFALIRGFHGVARDERSIDALARRPAGNAHGGTYRGPSGGTASESERAARVDYSEPTSSAEHLGGLRDGVLSVQANTATPGNSDQFAGLSFGKSKAARGRVAGLPAIRGMDDLSLLEAVSRDHEETGLDTEAYDAISENPFKLSAQDPLSTFSIDVDTASYANVRRFLASGRLPPPDAVRVEELLNYFRYEYPRPEAGAPFSTSATVATCPWAPTHQLVQVGLRASDIDIARRQSSNLVFLVDVSGSMDEPDKLPLLVRSMKLLVEQLDQRDRVAIVVYAGASGLVLPSTTCDYKSVVLNALDALQAGGSTNGGAGIELAYAVATEHKIDEGQNRVILCTDGDFNVGITDQGSLVRLIEEKRKSGVFLSVLGFGTGNTKDSTMEMLADKGNGNYAYIDTLAEARKVLVNEMGGTLFTVAKDVKIQVEFNPSRVQAWRLVGYENRVLAHQDFNDDQKDAGEIGAGHNVTALYEIVPVGVVFEVPAVDPLRYQQPSQTTASSGSDELLNLKLRYKAPDGDVSRLIQTPIADTNRGWPEASPDFKFAASVAAFGMVLRKSPNVGSFTLVDVQNLAVQGIGEDIGGYRREFLELVRKAQSIGR